MHPTVVERELGLTLVLSPERSIPVLARLGYRSDDPFAVRVAFHIDDGLAELLAPTPADDLWLLGPWPSDESRDGE